MACGAGPNEDGRGDWRRARAGPVRSGSDGNKVIYGHRFIAIWAIAACADPAAERGAVAAVLFAQVTGVATRAQVHSARSLWSRRREGSDGRGGGRGRVVPAPAHLPAPVAAPFLPAGASK